MALLTACTASSLLESVDRIISVSTNHFKAEEVGQLSLFGAGSGIEERLDLEPALNPIPERTQLQWERELLGVYVSDHPLTPFMKDLTRVVTHFSGELEEARHQQAVCVAGEITVIRPYQTRSGKPMGFITLEDLQGTVELVVFPRTWQEVSPWVETGKIVLARGKVDLERGNAKVLVDQISTELSVTHAHNTDNAPFPLPPPTDPGRCEVLQENQDEKFHPSDGDELAQGNDNIPDSWSGNGLPENQTEDLVVAHSQRITIRLESTGDRKKDAQRAGRLHGLLTSFPGNDHFAFYVYEGSRKYLLEFPNATTDFCPTLHHELRVLVGEGNILLD